jgi:two-component system NtrC family response regulator/two-component system response regulator HydG
LFLDEIAEMNPSLQVKLLRALQEKEVVRIGSNQTIKTDCRIIAATNQDLEEAVKTGTFREDLYYRLNVVKIDLPALKNRREDIPLLARYFIQKYSRAFGKSIRGLTDQALRILMDHTWPGNVRELENVIERAVIMAETHEILPEDLPSWRAAEFKRGTGWSLEEIEKEHIAKVLAFTKGEIKRAAELLGINPTTLWRKLKKMDNKKDQSP